ncbi:formimidoylglutamate deiminase [Vibrio sp. HN007]|uniref:formimidoylglutamate deiminase n=1 Tax=Vibrio iocasae TaxID=3098914 RepID=UPI0035D450D1
MAKQAYFAKRALISNVWKKDVRFEVENGVIVSVKTDSNADQAIYLTGPTIPSMVNLHSHAFQSAMAGLAEVCHNANDSFWSWRDVMYKMVQSLTPDDVRVIATQLYIDMLKAGYTQVAEFNYLHHSQDGSYYATPHEMSLQLKHAADVAGLGLTLLPVLYSYSGFGAKQAESGQARFINDVDSYFNMHQACESELSKSPLHQIGVCFHSLRAVTEEQIIEVLGAANNEQPIHIHIAEQQKEVRDCIDWSGQRPVEWLSNRFNINEQWCFIHATHLNQHELNTIAQNKIVAGLCPTTEANLGDGIFPATDFVAKNGVWGIGSDSHVSLSVADELRTLEYSQRLKDQKRNRLYDVQNNHVGDFLYQQALQGGNQASGVNIGLDIGCRADFIVLDHEHPYIAASKDEDLLNRWLFASNENLIRHVYVAGKQVITDFKHRDEQQSGTEYIALLQRLFM